MFFDNDILFRNGSLALIWMAGNEEFRTKKGRRNKDYQAVLKTNVVTVCKDLRGLFPSMGSAYGLSLKKMGTLVKGVGVIYAIKIEEFGRDVFQATIALKRPVTLASHQIDLPRGAKSKPTTVNPKQVDAADNLAVNDEFGGIPLAEFEEGIPANFDFGEQAFGTPRQLPSRLSNNGDGSLRNGVNRVLFTPTRTLTDEEEQVESRRRQRSGRKRQREEDDEETMYRDVCRRLQTGIDENLDAHCLREDYNTLLPENNGTCQNEYDFGDGMDLLNAPADMPQGPAPDFEMDFQPPQSPPAAGQPDDPSAMGPPSGLEFDGRSKILHTPTGAGTRAENTRRHRNQDQDPDATLMELGEIENGHHTPRRIRSARRRLRLEVDRQTTFSLEEMLHRMNTVKASTTMAELDKQLVRNRAPGKSEWKFVCSKIENFIRSAGRPCRSSALNEMIEEIMENQLENGKGASLRVGRSEATIEQQRDAGDQTSNAAGISVSSVIQNGQSGADIQLEPLENPSVIAPATPVPAQQPDLVGSSPQFAGMQAEYEGEADAGFGTVAAGPEMEAEEFRVPAEPRQRRKSRESRVDEQSRLANRLDGLNTFSDLFPLGRVSRKKASKGFSLLLKMQAKKEVLLHEEAPYGPIRIEQLLSNKG